jgi:iron complex outermembrane recepter protein
MTQPSPVPPPSARRPVRRPAGGRPASLIALVLLAVAAPPAGAVDEPIRLDPVVVTSSRLEQRAGEAPASMTVLTREDIEQSASPAVDELLRQVPGFSLFRRGSSLVSHPTAQGLSLRGIGPSGASRALVLVDGVPVNDPFGGWVAWSRLPMLGIDQIEVVRGGGSSVWGNGALGGVVHVLTARPAERAAFAEVSAGTQDTMNVDVLLTEARGPFRLALEANVFETGGYPVVRVSRRGPIDIDAESAHRTLNARLEWVPSADVSLFLTGNLFDEDRVNGTRLQVNDTRAGSVALGGRVRSADGSEWSAHAYTQRQTFHSVFTSQAPDRASETLALDQTVPSTAVGAAVSWTRRLGAHRVLAGLDGRWTEGQTDEDRWAPSGAFLGTRSAGGAQALAGVYVQDVVRLGGRGELTAGVRADYWRAYDGFRRDRAPSGAAVTQSFADVDRLIASPRVGVRVSPTASTDVRASVYQGFRVPTINELYRVFRVRNDVTAANERLRPERLTGGELGAQQRSGPFEGRVTGFWNEVQDLVANVTVAPPLPDCPPPTTCRQRQNLDRARIRGIETEVEYRPARDWRLVASHLFTDARVVEAARERGLEGKRLAQVPANTAALSVRYQNPAIVTARVTARFIGRQFEDDRNRLPLGASWVFDAYVSRALARWADAFVAVENLLDEPVTVGRTTEGTVSIGAPLMARGGVRLRF